ncbi:MAG: hypothetical protein JXX14_03725 [Deltaproteobacteria bacterium]|nr:hypothetical protein [Deltaproteobacteria bacterium]
MGKVITNKIIVISRDEPIIITPDEPIMLTPDGPARVPEPMHLNEETVLVFDEYGQCVGNVSHEEVKDMH